MLLNRYQNLIFSLCYKMTGNYFTAEDLAQETFLAAYCHMDTFDGQHEKAWLCTIAMNKCLDHAKKTSRHGIPEAEEKLEALSDEKRVEDHLLASEVRQELKTACQQLKPPYRDIAMAYFYEEKSPQEIAREREENLKTVQTQIYRARAKLQKIYGKERMP